MAEPKKADPISDEPRLLAIPPQIPGVRGYPPEDMRWKVALAPYPAERSWALRVGLVSAEEWVEDMVRHVEAEMRRNAELTPKGIEAMAAEWGRIRVRSSLRVISIALAADLMVGGILFASGQL